MSDEYRHIWKAERGYYNLLPFFHWLSDEECDWWEEQQKSIKCFKRTEDSIKRDFGLLPTVISTGAADKEVVRAKVDIVDLYLRLFDVPPPRRSGSRYVSVCCGLHGEKIASLSLDTQLKRYNCFSCGEKGDCFQLYQKVYGCSFPEAVDAIDRTY